MNDGDTLTGKHALVCGSTQGIGRACAFEFAARGAAVTLIARDTSALADTADAVRSAHPDTPAIHTLTADFGAPEDVRGAVARHLTAHGTIHVLLNNTGGPPGGPIADAEPAAFERAFRQHLVCNQLLAQAVTPGMREAGYGRIVNIVSTSVKQPIPGLGVSNTIRGAVASWAKTLARELAPDGITVNNVLPGFTDTGRMRSLIASRAQSQGRTEAEVEAGMVGTVPMGRIGRPEEVAAAAGFLASPAASYITGVSLPVDGGRIECL